MFNLHACRTTVANELIDCTFYQTERACAATPLLHRSVLSSDSKFRQMRNYFNETRCRMLTQLVQRDITGLELIRAFEQAPNLIEKMYTADAQGDNDDFIDQLVNVAHRSIIESPHRCESTSHRSPVEAKPSTRSPLIKAKPKPPLQRSPLSSPVQVNERGASIHSPLEMKTEPPVSPRNTISSASVPFSTPQPSPSPSAVTLPPSLPRIPSHQSSDQQPFSMGYQWKGEDD